MPPEERPIGRAALRLAADGIVPIFGDQVEDGLFSGFVARPGGWTEVAGVAIKAAYDRFPSRLFPDRYGALLAGLGATPVVNSPALMAVFQDKLATQALLESLGMPMPSSEQRPDAFRSRLREWGAGYLKPRYGTAGRGVVRLTAGDRCDLQPSGPTAEADGPLFLQCAITPPAGWRGVCVRVAAQREVDGRWMLNPAVVRRSRHDWVVNAARGSEVAPADEVLPAATMAAIAGLCENLSRELAARPEGRWLFEFGVDLVIDREFRPWLLEINSRPLGRLQALATREPQRFADVHLEACMRPLRALAAALR